jgi:hypothetical protein
VNVFDRVGRLWWVNLPRFGARLASSLGFTLLDGLWIGTLRVLNVVATPAALAAGLWIGWQQPGFNVVPSESLTLLAVFVVVGVVSAQLGLTLLCGFVVGNFFLADTAWSFTARALHHDWWGGEVGAYLLRVRLPLLISYGVLAVVLVKLPLGMKAIARALVPGDRAPLVLRVLIALVAQVALVAVVVYLWALASPVLLRPVWSWIGLAPTVDAIRPLQHDAATLARVAAAAAAARLAIQTLLVTVRPLGERAAELERDLARPLTKAPLYDRLPRWLRSIVTAALSTVLLAGLCATWLDAACAFAAIALFQLLRTGALSLPITPWVRLMDRVPVLLRFAAGIAAVYFVGAWFLPDRVRTAETFRPQLVFLLLGLAVFFVLIPSVPGSRRGVPIPDEVTA